MKGVEHAHKFIAGFNVIFRIDYGALCTVSNRFGTVFLCRIVQFVGKLV